MPDANNPIRLAYDSFWDALEESPAFIALFPHGTRKQVRYDAANDNAPDPDLDTPAPADYPRCRIVFRGALPILHHDTSHSVYPMQLSIEICTGQQMQGGLFDCLWAIFCGSANWFAEMREAVLWNSYKIVTSVEVKPLEVDIENEKRNRGTKQWIGVGDVTITLAVKTEDLRSV